MPFHCTVEFWTRLAPGKAGFQYPPAVVVSGNLRENSHSTMLKQEAHGPQTFHLSVLTFWFCDRTRLNVTCIFILYIYNFLSVLHKHLGIGIFGFSSALFV